MPIFKAEPQIIPPLLIIGIDHFWQFMPQKIRTLSSDYTLKKTVCIWASHVTFFGRAEFTNVSAANELVANAKTAQQHFENVPVHRYSTQSKTPRHKPLDVQQETEHSRSTDLPSASTGRFNQSINLVTTRKFNVKNIAQTLDICRELCLISVDCHVICASPLPLKCLFRSILAFSCYSLLYIDNTNLDTYSIMALIYWNSINK